MADQEPGGSAAGGNERSADGGRAGASDSRSVAEVMSTQLVTVSSDATVVEAARLMRDHDIGPVLVMDGDELRGILTDRDITVRAVAEGRDVATTPVSEVVSQSLTTVSSSDALDTAAETMRGEALRRVVVVEGGRPVGMLSLGDLAQSDEAADDAGIALSDISAAPPTE
jgi:CBS domain-containing protein